MFLRPTAGQDRDRDHLFYLFPNLGYIVVHCVSVKETLTLYTLSCGSFSDTIARQFLRTFY